MKKIFLMLSLSLCTSGFADFKILQDAKSFNELVAECPVPVVVQFAAEWCGPCQDLKRVFKEVAEDYDDSQVVLAYVDADQNAELRKYLQGGYPTVRTFLNGKLGPKKFTGSQSEGFVRKFVDSVVGHFR